MRRAWIVVVILSALLVLFVQAFAPKPIPGNPYFRSVAKAWDGFPNPGPSSPNATLVAFNGDLSLAQLTIVSSGRAIEKLGVSLPGLLKDLGWPEARISITRGSKIGSIKVDLTRYVHTSGYQMEATIPIGRVMSYLRDMDMPKPMGLAVKGKKFESVTFQGSEVDGEQLQLFLDVRPDAVIAASTTRHVRGLLYLIFLQFCLFVVFPYQGAAWIRKSLKARAERKGATQIKVTLWQRLKTPIPGTESRFGVFDVPWMAALLVPLFGGRSFSDDADLWMPKFYSPEGQQLLTASLLTACVVFTASLIVVGRRMARLRTHLAG